MKELRKQGIPGGSRSSVSSSLLLNIPPSGGPSAFHPNNILCSSTPTRQRTARHTSSHRDSRSSERDFHLDPNETPIKGHGVKRKTVTKSATKTAQPKPTPSVPLRTNVVRHVARSSSSQSESDHVDSDSCNIDHSKPHVKVVTNSQNVPVVKSTDTENDFPTTDFNNEDELNDLNRTGGKHGTMPVQGAASNQSVASALKLSTAGHPLPVVDWNEHGAKPKYPQSAHGASPTSAPILRQKVYKDEQSSGERSEPKEYSPKNFGSRSVIPQAGNNLSQPKSEPKVTVPSVPTATPRLSDSSPQHHHQPVLSEDFDDDMLFDKPSFQSNISQRHRRTPSNGDTGMNNLGLSRGRDAPLKTPQDPSVHPILPAVMPAKSSDLTIFSQRSPARFKSNFEQPDLDPPPFPLALVNPTESRPKIPRTPPPILTQTNKESQGVDISTILEGVNGHRKMHEDQHYDRRLPEREISSKDRDNSREQPSESPEPLNLDYSPLSTNQWYNTPANLTNHIATSVQKSTNISSEQSEAYNSKNIEPNNNKYDQHSTVPSDDRLRNFQPLGFEEDETGLKTVDDNLPEFLPIQARHGVHDKPAQSLSVAHKDVASRLKSAFSKPEPDNSRSFKSEPDRARIRSSAHDHSRSKHMQNNLSGHSDSGHVTNLTVETTQGDSENGYSRLASKDGAFSDTDIHKPKVSTSKGRQHVSRSPVGDRNAGSKTPVNQKGTHSPCNISRSASNVIKTEKLNNGSAFSPIHPQPVTNSVVSKTTVGQSSKDLVYPKPVVSPSSSDPRNLDIESMSIR